MPHSILFLLVLLVLAHAAYAAQPPDAAALDFNTPVDPALQAKLESIDTALRAKFAMTPDQTNVGILDLDRFRVAMINPDHTEYAASVAKVGILLAYFQTHPEQIKDLDPTVRHELGLMIRISSNEMASKYSHIVGLKKIQEILDSYGLYDKDRGGGIWVGKHYGKDVERYADPVSNNSHAASVRQLLRFYLLMNQGKLISPEGSARMREIFASPDIPLDDFKFTKGLKGRGVTIVRKSGTWEDWLHDTAEIKGFGRHYVLVALTRHPKGDDYLEALAPLVDDVMMK